MNIVELELDQLVLPQVDKSDPRFSKEKLLELCKSILKLGLLHPIIVRPTVFNQFYVVDGVRRVLAHKILAKKYPQYKKIKAIVVRNVSDLAVLINELQEKYSPVTLARIFKDLRDRGYTLEEIAQACGKSKSWVTELLTILESPLICDAIQKGEIPVRVGYEIVRNYHTESERSRILEMVRGMPREQALLYIKKGVRPTNKGSSGRTIVRHCHLCTTMLEKGEFQTLTLCNNCYSALISLYKLLKEQNISIFDFIRLWRDFVIWLKTRK